MGARDTRVDRYLAGRAAFARPILRHLRSLVHAACPAVEEEIKWGMPWFCYRGKLMCYMAAFTKHAAFGFYRSRLVLGARANRDAMGGFGRLTNVRDLPSRRVLAAYVRKAMALTDAALAGPRKTRASKMRASKTRAPKTRAR